MLKLSEEESKKASVPVGIINRLSAQLNLPYLKKCLKEMKEQHSWRDRAMVLNPNPMSHMEKQDLESAKIKQLELIINLGENAQEILNCEKEYINSKKNAKFFSNFFDGE